MFENRNQDAIAREPNASRAATQGCLAIRITATALAALFVPLANRLQIVPVAKVNEFKLLIRQLYLFIGSRVNLQLLDPPTYAHLDGHVILRVAKGMPHPAVDFVKYLLHRPTMARVDRHGAQISRSRCAAC